MESEDTKLAKKKRTVNKPEWSKEKRKRLRIAGKEYVNSKGELVTERQPGPDCECRRKCYERIPKATRLKLFKGYYGLKSHDEQNAYLFGLIRKVPIARKRAEGSTRRTCTFNYYIRIGGQETQVCVKALANIHGVGKSKIHILCEKLGQNVLFPRDERGRHSKMPKKVSDETVELAKSHILSIMRSDRAKDFLKDEKANNGPDVNITQMHKDFLDTYDPEYAQELVNYEKIHGVQHEEREDQEQSHNAHGNTYTLFQNANQTWELSYQRDVQQQAQQQVQVVVDSEGMAHQVITPTDPLVVVPTPPKKKRKTTKDGRPEPIIRQWFYSKLFHEVYTTKEAIALRKKVLSWKCNDDYVMAKPPRKHRNKKSPSQQPATIDQQHFQVEQQQVLPQLQQVQIVQARVKGSNTFSIPITTQQIPAKIQLQSIPIKKKPLQVFNTATGSSGQDNMFSVYPMILQDITGLEGHAVPIQHFQGQPMAITTNLQALGMNISIAPQNGQQTVSVAPVMSYKFE